MSENLGANFSIDITNLKAGLAQANRLIRESESEFKAAAAGMDDWTKSQEGLEKKIKSLNDIADLQQKKVDALKAEYQRLVSQGLDPASAQATNLRTQINNETAALNNTRSAITQQTTALQGMQEQSRNTSSTTETLTQKVQRQQAELKDLKEKYVNVAAEQGTSSEEAKNLARQIEALSGDLQTNETRLKEARTALQNLQTESSGASSQTETLTDKVKRQQSELKDLKQQYINVSAEQGASSTEAQNLARQIENLSSDLQTNETRLREASDAADDLDHSLENVDEEANNTSSGGITAFGVALGNLVSNIIQSAISKLKDLVTETINVGKAFDSSMSQVGAVSGATGEELDLLREKAKEMGASTKFTASEAADAFNYMAMAGWKTEDMISGIDGVLSLAAASGADLATTSDIVTDALTAMGYSAGDAGRLADVMAAASSNANTNVEMMGQTFKYAAPVVGALGYSMEDTAVAVGLMANAGIKADQAGTALRSILNRMAAPTKESGAAMDKLGISLTDSERKMKSLDTIMRELRESFAGMSETEQTATAKHLAGAEAMSGLLAIVNAAPEDFEKLTLAVGSSGTSLNSFEKTAGDLGISVEDMKTQLESVGVSADEFKQAFQASKGDAAAFMEQLDGFTDSGKSAENALGKMGISVEDLQAAMDSADGAAADMAKTMQDNLGGDMTKLGSKFEGIQLTLYEKFEPALRKAVEALDKLLDVFNWLIKNGGEVAGVITGVGTAVGTFLLIINRQAILTAFIGLLGKLKAGFLAVNAVMAANPVGLVIAAVAGLVAAFVVLWKKSEKFRNFWINLWEKIKKAAEPVIKALSEWFSKAWDSIKKAWSKVGAWFAKIWSKIKEAFAPAAKVIGGYFKIGWENIKTVWSIAGKYFKTIWENIKQVFSAVKSVLSGDFSGAWKAIKKIWSNTKKFFSDVWNNGVKKIFANIDKFFGGVFSKAWEKIKAIWKPVAKWFNDKVVKPIKDFFAPLVEFFRTAWNIIKQLAEGCWKAIKAVWSKVSGWFKTNVIEPIKKFFTEAWNIIKQLAEGCWKAIKAVWSKVSNWFKVNVIEPVKKFFTEAWDIIKQLAEGCWKAIKAVWSKVSGWFKDNVIEPVKKFFTEAWDIIKQLAEGCWKAIKAVWSAVSGWFKDNVIEPVKKFFTEAWDIIKQLAEGCWNSIKAVWSAVSEWFRTNVIEPVKQFFTKLWDGIKSAAQAAWDGIKSVWSAVSGWFKTNIIEPVANFFRTMWDGIKTAASTAWDGIKSVWISVSGWFSDNVVAPVKNWFSGMWDRVKSGASDAWDGIKSVFGGVADWFKDKFSKAWQNVKDVFSTGGKVFEGIKDGITSAFKTVVNAIIRGINKVIAIPFNAINNTLDKIRDVEIAGIQPFEGLISRFTVPEIPELAKGGVVRTKTHAIIGEDGAEAVVPLEHNTGWLDKLAAKLTENVGGAFAADSFKDISATIKTAAENISHAVREAVGKIKVQQITAPETGAAAKKAAQTITARTAEDSAQFGTDSGWIDELADKLAEKVGGGVTVNQTNNYAQAHSRYEIYKSQQATAAAVKLAMMRGAKA